MPVDEVIDAVAVSLVVSGVFTLGYWSGYTPAEEIDSRVSGQGFNFEGVQVNFVDKVNDWENVTAHYNETHILIVDNRSKDYLVESCTHEFLHYYIDETNPRFSDERLVENIDDKVVVPRCRQEVNGFA